MGITPAPTLLLRGGGRHAPFAALLLAGTALRLVTQHAVTPALLYADSIEYLDLAAAPSPAGHRPMGYPWFLSALSHTGQLWTVPLAQHAMALLICVALYLLLLRVGVRPWLAALGCAPFLLEPYQLVIEQYVLAETLAEALVAGAVVALLWRDRPGWPECLAAGVLLAAASVTRVAVLPLAVPALLYVLVRSTSRRDVLAAACLLAAFAAPLGAYAAWNDQVTGRFALSDYTGHFLYGRVAPIADCARLSPTGREALLCPLPNQPALDSSWYVWQPESPLQLALADLPGRDRDAVAMRFATAVIRRQPLDYAGLVASDTLRAFTDLRDDRTDGPWRFSPRPDPAVLATTGFVASGGRPAERVQPAVSPQSTRLLADYQAHAFLPGPAVAALLAAGLLGGLGLLRRCSGDRRLGWFALLLGVFAVLLLVTPTMTATFDARYVLPTLLLLPPAAVATVELALRAWTARTSSRRRPPADRDEPALHARAPDPDTYSLL